MAPSPSATATIIVHLLLKHRPGTRNPTVRRTLSRVVSLSSCGVAVTIQCSPQSRSVVREAPRMCEFAESGSKQGPGSGGAGVLFAPGGRRLGPSTAGPLRSGS
jgi:hypothetical protein